MRVKSERANVRTSIGTRPQHCMKGNDMVENNQREINEERMVTGIKKIEKERKH